MRHYVLAGGGTGGHLYPGLAVADALLRRDAAARITFLTTNRPLDTQLLSGRPFAQVAQVVRPWPSRPWGWPGFARAWWSSVKRARRLLRQEGVAAVLGLGGYAAGPAVMAAAQLGLPRAILNPDAVPGRANRRLARRVTAVFCQWEVTRGVLPEPDVGRVVGCPIRARFAEVAREDGCRHFGLDAGRPVLLVTGASQGARTVNRVMQRVWPEFATTHADWQLLHLSGAADEAETRAAYEAAGVVANVVAFTHEMPLALAAADVVVSRAGASTLAELTVLGKPSILLPYPFDRGQHQRANADVLGQAGAAIVLDDRIEPAANAGPLGAALERVANAAERERMAAAARTLGRANAADDVAAWLAAQ